PFCLRTILHAHPYLLSFPTRRSSDLSPAMPSRSGLASIASEARAGDASAGNAQNDATIQATAAAGGLGSPTRFRPRGNRAHLLQDRKSTRLNSSHQIISYAVFCLKKK